MRGQTRPIGPVNPFEVAVLGIGVTTSSSVLFGWASPTSISSQLSSGFLTAWAGLLLAGSLLALVGLLWWGDWVTGIEIKRPGLVMFAFACAAYSFAAVGLGSRGMAVAITNGAFALVAVYRVVQVTRGIRALRRDISAVRTRLRR